MKELLKLHVQLFNIKIFIAAGVGETFTTTKALYYMLCSRNVQLSLGLLVLIIIFALCPQGDFCLFTSCCSEVA